MDFNHALKTVGFIAAWLLALTGRAGIIGGEAVVNLTIADGLSGETVHSQGKMKHQDVDVSRHGLDNIVRQFAVCEKGRIWFLGRFDLNSYDPRTEKVTHYQLPAPVSGLILTKFTCLGNGRFAVGTRGNGLPLSIIQIG